MCDYESSNADLRSLLRELLSSYRNLTTLIFDQQLESQISEVVNGVTLGQANQRAVFQSRDMTSCIN